ncbi:MAG: hypothetical protein NTX76_03615 [Alphaproteobacteria bacterium]|nr:hypothetical protein [Alphaproteobacteria bacterium]
MKKKWKYCVSVICAVSIVLPIEDGWAAQRGVEDSENRQSRAADFIVLRAQEGARKKVEMAEKTAQESTVKHEFPILMEVWSKRHDEFQPMLDRFLLERVDRDKIVGKKSDESITLSVTSFFGSISDKLEKFILGK